MKPVPIFFGEPGLYYLSNPVSFNALPARGYCGCCYDGTAAAGAGYSLTSSAPSPFADSPGPNKQVSRGPYIGAPALGALQHRFALGEGVKLGY